MICAITGELRRVEPDRVHLASGPVLYEILVPAFDLTELHASLGETVTLQTIFDLEGDATRGGLAPRLIGFLRLHDKKFFQLFVTVKGIGPKRALRSLVQPVGQIAAAIEAKNARFLQELPEIGKRTAEQIIAELAGKLAEFALEQTAGSPPLRADRSPTEQDAIEAVMALGIPRPEAERLLERARQTDPTLKTADAVLREMLRLRTVRA
ncbi:MAG: Holliday junction branch migration protein RuvA [Tepidisphaeraceae bacterium]|jgi:Holliday junction DNA helicase RuvA